MIMWLRGVLPHALMDQLESDMTIWAGTPHYMLHHQPHEEKCKCCQPTSSYFALFIKTY